MLAHAPNIISGFNNGLGLEQLSEEGLEESNKLIRRYRERLSRKFSFQDNIKDVFTRMLCQSDPVLSQNRKLKKSVPDNCVVLEDISKQEIMLIHFSYLKMIKKSLDMLYFTLFENCSITPMTS